MTDKRYLILMPGLMLDERLWRGQIAAFAGEFEIIVPDCSKHDNVEELVRDFLRRAPERFAIAGLSKGGTSAFEVFKQAPERVTRLALLDTIHVPETKEAGRYRRTSIERVKNGELKALLLEMVPTLIHKSHWGDQLLCQTIVDMGLDLGPAAVIRQLKAVINRPDYGDLLAKINVPTLVLCGREDAHLPPKAQEKMAGLIAGARFVSVPDCGHLSTMEQPEAVNVALQEWLGVEA